MLLVAGPAVKIHFTSLSKASRDSLSAIFGSEAGLADAI
jgi:hypothetical protein